MSAEDRLRRFLAGLLDLDLDDEFQAAGEVINEYSRTAQVTHATGRVWLDLYNTDKREHLGSMRLTRQQARALALELTRTPETG